MMETHRNVFIKISIFTLILMTVSYLTRNYENAYQICLALLGSSVVGVFLEFVNFLNARRSLVMQIITDNNITGNFMCDALWIYRNTLSPEIKADVLLELYEKTQNNLFILTRECYVPLWKKDVLVDTIRENTNVIAEIYDLLLEFQRLILTGRKEMFVIDVDENTIPKDRTKSSLLDEAALAKISEKVETLMTLEHKLANFNVTYRTHYKLIDIKSVKSHNEVLDEIVETIEKGNAEE